MRSVVLGEEGFAYGEDGAVGGGVEDLDEGDEERVDAGEQAEVAADVTAGPGADGVAEVAPGEQEERDPEQQEDAPDRLAEAEGDDPEQQGEDAPEQQDDAARGGGWCFEPAGANGPLQQSEPPPEEAVGGEGDHAEGVAGFELEDAGDKLGYATIGKGQRHDSGDGFVRQKAGVDGA